MPSRGKAGWRTRKSKEDGMVHERVKEVMEEGMVKGGRHGGCGHGRIYKGGGRFGVIGCEGARDIGRGKT